MWYVYSMEPIDFGWGQLQPVSKHLVYLATQESLAKLEGMQNEEDSVDSFLAAFNEAKSLAFQAGWEGDFRGQACVFFLPQPGSGKFEYGFTWKQDNNGVTFVVSPFPLPWLEDRAYGEYRIR